MPLDNLKIYNWEQGTLNNPVSLTGTQFSWLINLLKKSTITKDIRGYIEVGGPITSYEKYLAELAKDENGQPLLHLVNPIVTPVEYTIEPQERVIKEGNRTKLNINGIGLEALKFRIISHTSTVPDYQARTTINTTLGYVEVAPARENATWVDVVTIQACPIWEEWDAQEASIVEFDITVNAQAVTSVTISTPQYVKPGATFNPVVNFLPVAHTKPIVNTLEDAAAKKGICYIPESDDFQVSKTTDPTKMSATAPNEETPEGETWSLGCGVYAFTDSQTIATPSVNITVKHPYIRFTITTDGTFSDISSANPRVTLQKVDSQDVPIGESVVLTGTVVESSLVYTYGNGLVAGDGSEIYKAAFSTAPEGYRNIQAMSVVPSQVNTEIDVQYIVKRPDIYQVYSDCYEPISAIEMRGGFAPNKTRIGIALVTEQTSFLVSMISAHDPNSAITTGTKWINNSTASFDDATPKSVLLDALEDFDGEQNTIAIYNAWESERLNSGATSPLFVIRERTIQLNGITYNGFVASLGQLDLLQKNIDVLNGFIKTYYGSADFFKLKKGGYAKVFSSTKYDKSKYWCLELYNLAPSPYVSQPTTITYHHCVPTCFPFDETIIPLYHD